MFDVCKKREQFLAAKEQRPSSAVDYDELPAVSALLAGVAASDGKGMASPQYKLLLWAEGDWIKFLFSAGDHEPKCWGSFQGLARGLSGVEEALQKDNCDWRQPKADHMGLTGSSKNGKT